MPPVTVELETHLPAPPDVVWALLTHWERQGEWMLELRDIEVTSEGREGIGVEARGSVRIGGITTTDVIVVDVWDPPHALGVEHRGWVGGRGDFVLTPHGTGTSMRWVERFDPPLGVVGALGMRLFRPLIRRTFRRDLGVLADLVAQ